MKKLLFILFCLPLYSQTIKTIGDTTDLKSLVWNQPIILLQYGGSTFDRTGGGIFVVMDSTYAEGTHAFDHPWSGKQWARLGYTGGEESAFQDITGTTLVLSSTAEINGDITLANDETISNSVNGRIDFGAADLLTTGTLGSGNATLGTITGTGTTILKTGTGGSATDSSLVFASSTGSPLLTWYGTDGDASSISINTSDVLLFTGGGVAFSDQILVSNTGVGANQGLLQLSTNGTPQLLLEDLDAGDDAVPFWYMQSANNGSKGIFYLGYGNRTGSLMYGYTDLIVMDSTTLDFTGTIDADSIVSDGGVTGTGTVIFKTNTGGSGTDSSLVFTSSTGSPLLTWYGTDGDAVSLGLNTSDRFLFTGGSGGYSFDNEAVLTGGVTYPTVSTHIWTTGGSVVLATSGTDAACSNGDRYWTEIMIPYNVTLTGVSYLVGSVGGTDSVVVQLFNSAGTQVATSRLPGTAADIVGTAAQFQSVDFSSEYDVVAGLYYIAVQFNGITAKFRTYPIAGSKFIAGSVAGTWNVAANITPGTTFTADKSPICITY